MKIVIPGGSGQVGSMLARSFLERGNEVVILSRSPNVPSGRRVAWDAESLGSWQQEIDGADIVINMAGRSVNCRYHTRNRREIKESRIKSTHIIGEAIRKAAAPPSLWLQASTATIYAHRYDAPNGESEGILGGNEPNVPDTWNFSIEVAKSWEATALAFDLPNTRLVLLRSAITFSPDPGSVFEVLLNLVRRGLGGKNGDGRQFVSWIHDQDFIRAIDWLIDHPELSGPVNLASPNPLPNAEFMREFRKAWGAPIGLPATKWMLEIASFFLRTETELILKSRRVIPERLLQSGFEFEFPTWAAAISDLCARWKRRAA
ncbi:MAG: TIGR01777 family oxidoreductase [Planctomycetaceae bacterium]|nr:TIGR01777 family oxidoreductase [Planctomycetaceae bacterium]